MKLGNIHTFTNVISDWYVAIIMKFFVDMLSIDGKIYIILQSFTNYFLLFLIHENYIMYLLKTL